MPAIAIIGSADSGHGAYGGTSTVTGDGLFKVNDTAVACTGDVNSTHTAPDHTPHTPVIVGGSKMTINGKVVAKVGDPLACGAVIVSGDDSMQIT